MKNILLLIVAILFSFSLSIHSQVYNMYSDFNTQRTYSEYKNNMNITWNVYFGGGAYVKVDCSVYFYPNDYVKVYEIDANNNEILIGTFGGGGEFPNNGALLTTKNTGRAKIVLTTNSYESYSDTSNGSMAGAMIKASKAELAFFDTGIHAERKSYFNQAFFDDKVTIGSDQDNSGKVFIRNEQYNNAITLINTTNVNGATGIRLSNSNTSSSGTAYGLHSSVYKNNGGDVYGIYSSVNGISERKWSGYFTGGHLVVQSGNLGIGTITPVAPLQITSTKYLNGAYISAVLGNSSQDWTTFGGVTGGRIRGSNEGMLVIEGNPTGTGNKTVSINPSVNSNILLVNGGGNVGIGTGTPEYKLDVNGIFRSVGAYISGNIGIGTNNPLEKLDVNGTIRATNAKITGNVGIGVSNPQNKLEVNGTVRATEIRVVSVEEFADFVFEEGYILPSLNEVNKYIKQNGHLNGIPSAAEVKENGMSLVEMQVKLLQKIEELTLYTIEQQQRIEELEKRLNEK